MMMNAKYLVEIDFQSGIVWWKLHDKYCKSRLSPYLALAYNIFHDIARNSVEHTKY